eukprot:gene12670-13970_t
MNGTESTQNGSKGIPMRRVVVKDPSHMPSHYSETPGGTMFSTTPGGTRIIYERKFLLDIRNSPLSKTPTKQLPVIPGVTLDDNGKLIEEDEEALENEKNSLKEKSEPMEEQNGSDPKKNHDDIQFDMDI